MSKRRLIGIDCDDVVIDFNTGLAIYNRRFYGTTYCREDITSYKLNSMWGCTPDEAIQRVIDFYQSDEHQNLLPVEGAVEAIERLSKNNDLVIITARPENVRGLTIELVHKHFPKVFGEPHFLGHFDGDQTHRKTKGEVCRELGVEVFIEDALSNALSVSSEGIPVLLFDTPWNQGELPPNTTRVFSWSEILKILS